MTDWFQASAEQAKKSSDGCYLVNCTKNGEQRSAVAYYKNFKLGGGNDGHQPDAFVYTGLKSFTMWEGEGHVTFKESGVEFKWKIFGTVDANQHLPAGAAIGAATNGFNNHWQVYKDNNKHMFTNADGFDCKKIYYVFN